MTKVLFAGAVLAVAMSMSAFATDSTKSTDATAMPSATQTETSTDTKKESMTKESKKDSKKEDKKEDKKGM